MSFIIREATAADVPAIAQLHVDTFIETHGGGPNSPTFELRERQWREILKAKDESEFCFVIQGADGRLVGFARGVPYDDPTPPGFDGLLNKIYILQEFHRQGLGRRLVGHVACRFLSLDVSSIR